MNMSPSTELKRLTVENPLIRVAVIISPPPQIHTNIQWLFSNKILVVVPQTHAGRNQMINDITKTDTICVWGFCMKASHRISILRYTHLAPEGAVCLITIR